METIIRYKKGDRAHAGNLSLISHTLILISILATLVQPVCILHVFLSFHQVVVIFSQLDYIDKCHINDEYES